MSSRYESSKTTTSEWRGKLVRGLELRPNLTWRFSFTHHQVKDGQRIDTIADMYHDDPELWWMTADANPEQWWMGEMEPGTVIRVPYV